LDGKIYEQNNVSVACSNHILTNHTCRQQLLPIPILHTFISLIRTKFKTSSRKHISKHNPPTITYQHMPHRYLHFCAQDCTCQPENTAQRPYKITDCQWI